MKLHEVLSKVVTDYMNVSVKGNNEYSKEWKIEKGSFDYSFIPDEELNAKVIMIIPYYSKLSIIIDKY